MPIVTRSGHVLKVNDAVVDVGFPWRGVAVVKEVLKTRIKIQYPSNLVIYDKPHAKFLEILEIYDALDRKQMPRSG